MRIQGIVGSFEGQGKLTLIHHWQALVIGQGSNQVCRANIRVIIRRILYTYDSIKTCMIVVIVGMIGIVVEGIESFTDILSLFPSITCIGKPNTTFVLRTIF